jgi:hypothetical protein
VPTLFKLGQAPTTTAQKALTKNNTVAEVYIKKKNFTKFEPLNRKLSF